MRVEVATGSVGFRNARNSQEKLHAIRAAGFDVQCEYYVRIEGTSKFKFVVYFVEFEDDVAAVEFKLVYL